MERFPKHHWQTLNALVGTDFGKSPLDSSFRLLLAQLDVLGFEALLREWMSAQLGVAEAFSTLVCVAPGFREADGKTLRGSIDQNTPGASRFISNVSLYSQDLSVAIAQTTYVTDASGEIKALRKLLEAVKLEGVLVRCLLAKMTPLLLSRQPLSS